MSDFAIFIYPFLSVLSITTLFVIFVGWIISLSKDVAEDREGVEEIKKQLDIYKETETKFPSMEELKEVQEIIKEISSLNHKPTIKINDVVVSRTPNISHPVPKSTEDLEKITALVKTGPLDSINKSTGRNMANEYIERKNGGVTPTIFASKWEEFDGKRIIDKSDTTLKRNFKTIKKQIESGSRKSDETIIKYISEFEFRGLDYEL